MNDVRFVKDGVARAIRTLRTATSPEPGDRVVPLSAQMVGLRFTVAAQVAGVESRVTAHSRRVGIGTHEPGRIDHGRDARRRLENLADGGPLFCRGDCRTRRRRSLPVPPETLADRLTLGHTWGADPKRKADES